MTKKAFIFDLDGVIVDTAKYHFHAWKKLANSIGVDFTEEENEQLKGVSRVKSLEKILLWGNKSISEEEFTELMTLKNDDYLSYVNKMDESDVLPGVKEVLDQLTALNIPIALGSASKNAPTILKKVKLDKVFKSVVDGNSVKKAKPNPEVFLKAAEQLGVSPKDCIVFEDSQAGVKAANIASMVSVGIGDKNILHEANYVFEDFTKISSNFINELLKK
ncbi:MAG: beta-phosphoglucomutase [Flavobacteriaceae bacterium]|mgnify:CR=1 FL=1|nr:beta-phosphoglucomutase [Mangrovimonas sp.]MCB0433474.1 beta-phosphoglucomutase [Mangrovimonas sp.]MCB0436523.1 beta-phosphoglucomutase [Mangrovimonas sp.]HRV54946.1 beta-phosphoglucomutase [Mangrovimonas sp.]